MSPNTIPSVINSPMAVTFFNDESCIVRSEMLQFF